MINPSVDSNSFLIGKKPSFQIRLTKIQNIRCSQDRSSLSQKLQVKLSDLFEMLESVTILLSIHSHTSHQKRQKIKKNKQQFFLHTKIHTFGSSTSESEDAVERDTESITFSNISAFPSDNRIFFFHPSNRHNTEYKKTCTCT